MMFYKLIHKRSMKRYGRSYFNILCVFIISLSMLSFTNIFCDSYYNYNEAVLLQRLTLDNICDIRVKNITKEEAKQYYAINNVDITYIDGNLDFVLLDENQFETVLSQIQKIFNKQHGDISHDFSDQTPTIHVFYGQEPEMDVDNGARITTTVVQVVLTSIAVITMVLIYSDYIEQRTEDIRTLSALGITERQLNRLFFGECNVLYLLSVVVGIPLGGVFVYLFCKVCEWVDMSQSNAIYPVFDLDIKSLIITALLGYIAIYITFRIVLGKILKIDASYTCEDSMMDFDPDKSREYYNQCDRHFDSFFSSVLQKRSSPKFRYLIAITACIIAVSIFMLNAANYLIYTGNSYGRKDSAAIAAGVSNAGLFIMVIVYAVIYSLIIVHIFMKRQMESTANAVQILYALGADEDTIYSCYHLFTSRKIFTTELSGFGMGYGATILVFATGNYGLSINLWLLLESLMLALAYYFVYMFSMKKHFYKNCRSYISDNMGGVYGAA